ncbi:TetR family transcriptional regulator [Mycolicibacterium duvalii]|nr:TetR family transcriptional regulator [Mycolicibacterium duvalii]PEG39459.1 TetR family transcriptional regulator [Mycolicibacterium duvalii]
MQSSSLRERKKAQTRLAIRREAFRLFDEQGYANTTVEQIAEAAEVSPRTFYRYFKIKEALLISDDHSSPIVRAFVDAPAELSVVAAYRHAMEQVFGGLSADERVNAIAGQQMLYQVPEARGLIYTEYIRLIGLLTDALAERLGPDTEEFERRVTAGAIVGVLIAISDDNPLPQSELSEALKILDARLS